MAADRINELFWLNYARAIKEKAGAKFGESGAFFIGSEVQKGPVAGDGIPDEYTNQGLYDVANNLLASDNLFYNPSAQHGYAQALQLYLNWVDLGAKPNPTDDLNLLRARDDQKAYQTAYDREQDRAYAQFEKEGKRGLTELNFPQWIAGGHAPGYMAAKSQLASVGARIMEIQQRIGGPISELVNDVRSKLGRGLNTEGDFPGYNMQAAMGNVLSTADLLRLQAGNEPIPKPTTYLVPAYDAPSYKKFVQDAQNRSGGNYDPKDSIVLSIDMDDDMSKYDFGQTSAGANVGFNYGWLGFSAGGSGSESTITFETEGDASSVKVKLLFDRVEAIDLRPGLWNLDISQFKLRDDAPEGVKGLVRPSQLIVASKFGYEISISDSLASSFDSLYNQTVSAGGSINILGLPISLGASGSSTTEKETHQATWDSASNTLTVQPKDDVQTATVLGVVGEKFSIL